jgi:hypothetical protein
MRASLAAAKRTLADAIEEARTDGYEQAMAQVEREVYSCEDMNDFLRWMRDTRREDA